MGKTVNEAAEPPSPAGTSICHIMSVALLVLAGVQHCRALSIRYRSQSKGGKEKPRSERRFGFGQIQLCAQAGKANSHGAFIQPRPGYVLCSSRFRTAARSARVPRRPRLRPAVAPARKRNSADARRSMPPHLPRTPRQPRRSLPPRPRMACRQESAGWHTPLNATAYSFEVTAIVARWRPRVAPRGPITGGPSAPCKVRRLGFKKNS
jgi:hypothetical protein